MKHFICRSLGAFLLAAGLAGALAAAAPNVTYSGKVVDAQGQPVPGATVEAFQFPTGIGISTVEVGAQQHTNTDSRGTFTFSMPASVMIAVAKKPGLAAAWHTWATPADAAAEMVLNAPSFVAGKVVDEAGKPVADADVSVVVAFSKADGGMRQEYIYDRAARESFTARTGADGRFRISDFPTNSELSLMAVKPGRTMRPGSNNVNGLPYHSGQEDIELALEPAGILEGKLTIKDTGQPLAGVKLQLQPAQNGFSSLSTMAAVESEKDGTFRFPTAPAGAYRVMAIFPAEPPSEWVTEGTAVNIASGETVRGVQVQVNHGAMLRVTVVAAEGHKPMTNVNVMAYGQTTQSSQSRMTGPDGVASFRLAEGDYYIYALQAGRTQGQTQTSVKNNQTNRVDLEIIAPLKVNGILRDASGAPVAGTRVSIIPNYSGSEGDTKSDADGHYEVTWQKPNYPGMRVSEQTYTLIARHPEKNLAVAHEVDEKTTELNLKLEPGLTATARIEDAKGKPIPDINAGVMFYSGNSGSSINNLQVKSDAQGHVEINALPRMDRYGLYLNAKNYGNETVNANVPEASKSSIEFGKVVLKLADRKLSGKVLGIDGQPAAGVYVNIYGQGQPSGNVQTDAKGQFHFDAVCEGMIQVSANLNSAYGSAQAMGGDTNVVVRFRENNVVVNGPTVKTTGTVRDSSGTPVPGARLTIIPTYNMMSAAKSDDSGHFTLEWQPEPRAQGGRAPGRNAVKYYIVARDPARNQAVTKEISESPSEVEITLEDSVSISGVVQDAEGNPLKQASINLNLMMSGRGSMVDQNLGKVDAEGNFSIPALPRGQQYYISASANGYGNASKQVSANQSRSNRVELAPFKLKKADRILAGMVLGTNGEPVAGAQVQVSGNGQPYSNTRSDSTGHFLIKPVCAGALQIFAYDQNQIGAGGRITMSANMQARGGDTNVVIRFGQNQNRNAAARNQAPTRETPLVPQPWTLSAVISWPLRHKAAGIALIGVQILALLGAAAFVFWTSRKGDS